MQGYALVEFAMKSEAEAAIKGTDRTTFLEKEIRTYVPCFLHSCGPCGRMLLACLDG